MESVWNQVKANLKELLPDHSFRMWIQPIQFLNSQPFDSAGSVLVTLTCPNSFSKKRVKENYISGITQEFLKLSLALGISDVHLTIDIANSHKVDVDKIDNPKVEIKKDCCPKKEPRKINKIDDQLPLPGLPRIFDTGRMLKKDYTFDQFVVGNISKSKKEITIDAIKKLICTEFGISEVDLISTSRKAKLVHPRQVAIYLSRKYTDQSIKIIGKSFNRYHATAIHSINAVEKAIQQQGAFSEQLNYLYKKIEAGKI
ncbi:chromosomal replication initiator protein DnaA [Candidatus Magnetoovum chiemensis]|nr:chromosomal replication initiator protein DnaA [Candidatus Magnetoovum chiemensis]